MSNGKPVVNEKERNEKPSEAKMTHLASYQGPRDQEIRLHNAEFRGKDYFDFRFYEKGARGYFPKERGIRLDKVSVEHLEDAVSRWKSFVEERQKNG